MASVTKHTAVCAHCLQQLKCSYSCSCSCRNCSSSSVLSVDTFIATIQEGSQSPTNTSCLIKSFKIASCSCCTSRVSFSLLVLLFKNMSAAWLLMFLKEAEEEVICSGSPTRSQVIDRNTSNAERLAPGLHASHNYIL